MSEPKGSERRQSERFVLSDERPVYLRAVHDGSEFRMLVENISTGGALLMCPAIYNSVQPGQRLTDGELVLADAKNPRVDVIIRWQFWPRIGVQFDNLSPEAASQISKLIESLKPSA